MIKQEILISAKMIATRAVKFETGVMNLKTSDMAEGGKRRKGCLTLSQISPGFNVSAVQVFSKHCGKG